MTAALIAEALAVGLQYTTDDGVWYDGSGNLRPPRHLLVAPVGVRVVDTSSDRDEVLRMAADWPDCSVYYRADVMDAALAHLAERAERAEAASRFDVAAYRHRLRVLRMRHNTDANRWAWAAILRAIEILDGMVAGAEVDAVESLNAAIEEDGRG